MSSYIKPVIVFGVIYATIFGLLHVALQNQNPALGVLAITVIAVTLVMVGRLWSPALVIAFLVLIWFISFFVAIATDPHSTGAVAWLVVAIVAVVYVVFKRLVLR